MPGIGLTDYIKPKNDAFTGIVQASQVLGGGGDGTLPDACVAESNVTQYNVLQASGVLTDNAIIAGDGGARGVKTSTILYGAGSLLFPGAAPVYLRDGGTKIYSPSANNLTIVADTALAITSPAVTLSGTLAIPADKYADFGEVASGPSNPSADTARLYAKDDGGTTKMYYRDSAGTETELGGAGSGETNTASNVGTDGVGVFDAKVGVDLQFRHVASTTDRITIALDAVDNDIDFTLEEGNVVHQNLSGAGTNTHAQIDSHIASTANPHATDIGNLGSGTLAELNAAVTDATLVDASHTHTESDITDLDHYDSADFATDFAAASIGDLADVGDATPTAGNVLRGNASTWESSALAAADLSNGTTGIGGAVVLSLFPYIAGILNASETNQLLAFDDNSSDNYLTIGNAADGGNVALSVAGSGINAGISLVPKGTAEVILDGLKWPQADGSAGQVLKTDGAAQLSWDSLTNLRLRRAPFHITSPVDGDIIFIADIPAAATVTEIYGIVNGGTSVLFYVSEVPRGSDWYDTVAQTNWVKIESSGTTATTSGVSQTSGFENAALAADTRIYLEVDTITGAVEELDGYVEYTID